MDKTVVLGLLIFLVVLLFSSSSLAGGYFYKQKLDTDEEIKKKKTSTILPSSSSTPSPSTSSSTPSKQDVPVSGGWSDWITSSECSTSCGEGTRTMVRTCTNPTPSINGKDCIGESTKQEKCNLKPCPIWSEWQNVGTCSKLCGEGTVQQIRKCLNKELGADCDVSQTQVITCNSQSCPTPIWSEWRNVGTCSKLCGKGTVQQTRTCINKDIGANCDEFQKQQIECNTQDCFKHYPDRIVADWTAGRVKESGDDGNHSVRAKVMNDCISDATCIGYEQAPGFYGKITSFYSLDSAQSRTYDLKDTSENYKGIYLKPNVTPVDALYTDWYNVGGCCPGTLQKQKRDVIIPSQNGGLTQNTTREMQCTDESKCWYKLRNEFDNSPSQRVCLQKVGNQIKFGDCTLNGDDMYWRIDNQNKRIHNKQGGQLIATTGSYKRPLVNVQTIQNDPNIQWNHVFVDITAPFNTFTEKDIGIIRSQNECLMSPNSIPKTGETPYFWTCNNSMGFRYSKFNKTPSI